MQLRARNLSCHLCWPQVFDVLDDMGINVLMMSQVRQLL
jgi:hypothetical protein